MNDSEFFIKKGMFTTALGKMFVTMADQGIDFEPLIIWAGLDSAANDILKDLHLTEEQIQYYRKLRVPD